MKILYAIQATGNGHISRAREVIPHLMGYGEVDLLISGRQAEVNLPYMIKYKKSGISYTFGKKGGIDFIDSIKKLKPINFIKDVCSFPVHAYDMVVNDFEPVTAWACKLQFKRCIALSHQAAYLSPNTPRPVQTNYWSEQILHNFAPTTEAIGFHFEKYDRFIHSPIIRKEIRTIHTDNLGHYTVYLPAHSDQILIQHLMKLKDVEWHVFSKHCKQAYQQQHIKVFPVQHDLYLNSFANCAGLITAGGFESPAEAMYLRKKLLVVPMQNQYEQTCNAEALKRLGVHVVKKIENDFAVKVKQWMEYGFPVLVDYPDETARIIDDLVTNYIFNREPQFSFR